MGKKKFIQVLLVMSVVLVGIIAFRIYHNLEANKQRAGRVSRDKTIAVEFMKVGRKDIQPELTFSANLDPVWSADISAKVEGRIDSLVVEEGMTVTAGQILARLDTSELEAQVARDKGSWYAAKATLEQAEIDFKRMQTLAAQGAVSKQELDAAKYKRDLAQGQVAAAAGSLNVSSVKLNNTEVTAPRDSIVLKRFIQAGVFVKLGNPIVTLGDVSTLLAKATVGEAQIGEISLGLPVKVLVNAYPHKTFTGTVTRISPMAALPSRTFTAEISIANQQSLLKPGMFATARVQGNIHRDALAVPQSALVMREDQKTVFVVLDEGIVQQRLLKIGYIGNGWVEVLDGVKEGETIVVSGQNKVHDGAKVISGSSQEGSK